jgi:predicted DNA-binding transcriptional regulator AlpA
VTVSAAEKRKYAMTIATGPSTSRRLLDVGDLQDVLQIKRSKAYELLRGPLAADVVRVGRLVRIPSDAVDRWIDEQRGRR